MKAKVIRYERLKNTGNFSHQKLGIEIEVEPGEKAADVLEKAREFVDRGLGETGKPDEYALAAAQAEIERAERMLERNREILAQAYEDDGDLPF